MNLQPFLERVSDSILWHPVMSTVVLTLVLQLVWRVLRWYIGWIAKQAVTPQHMGELPQPIIQQIRDLIERRVYQAVAEVIGERNANFDQTVADLSERVRNTQSRIAEVQDDLDGLVARPDPKAKKSKGRSRARAKLRQALPTQWDRIREDGEEPDDGSDETPG